MPTSILSRDYEFDLLEVLAWGSGMARAMTSAMQVATIESMNGRIMKSPTWGAGRIVVVVVIIMAMVVVMMAIVMVVVAMMMVVTILMVVTEV